jgi:hypothetical protein
MTNPQTEMKEEEDFDQWEDWHEFEVDCLKCNDTGRIAAFWDGHYEYLSGDQRCNCIHGLTKG